VLLTAVTLPTTALRVGLTHMTSLDVQDTVSAASVIFSLQVLTAVLLKFKLFCDMTPCKWATSSRRFEVTYYIHLRDDWSDRSFIQEAVVLHSRTW
jgi:hypothetical protein